MAMNNAPGCGPARGWLSYKLCRLTVVQVNVLPVNVAQANVVVRRRCCLQTVLLANGAVRKRVHRLPKGSTGGPAGSFRRTWSGARFAGARSRAAWLGHGDFLLVHHAIHDPVGPELHLVLVPGGDQHVVGLRLTRVGNV